MLQGEKSTKEVINMQENLTNYKNHEFSEKLIPNEEYDPTEFN